MTPELLKINTLNKSKKNLLGEDKKSSMYNTWRARVYTAKGKLAGFPDTWKTFQGFKENIPDGFIEGMILVRKDLLLPFSKENSMWIEKDQQGLMRLTTLEYNGTTKTLLEWCDELNLSYSGVRTRFFKGFSPEEILFGKIRKTKRKLTDVLDLEYQQQRDKVSRMLSAYRNRDQKRRFDFNLDRDFLNDLISKPCTYCGDTKLIGADRIDNFKGHTKDNVLPCCYTCNVTRGDQFTVEEMKLLGKTIRLIKENRQK